ncbi:major capsid protein [Pararhizobium sp.]|uniref:major capsid protein n=1 Tax=Pararhizobium sp. TaxID=1977563 RepID=UPI003D0A5C2A
MTDFLNIFNPGNAMFTKAALTGSVNTQPYVPEHTSKWLEWNTQGETKRTLILEFNEGSLAIIPEAPVGAPGFTPDADVRSAIPVIVPHFPMKKSLLAKQFEGVRAFGSELDETIQNATNQLMAQIDKHNKLIWEIGRLGAITGLVRGHNGSIRQNWFNVFRDEDGTPLTQTTHSVNFANANTKIRSELIAAKEKAEEHLGDISATGWVAICGKNRFRSITDHQSFEKSFERYNDGSALRDDLGIDGFSIASDMKVVKYSRSTVAGVQLIGDDDMYVCPIAPDMYQTRFAPGTSMADLGSTGLPQYVDSKFLDFGDGVEFRAQTNPLSYVTRLQAITKVVQTA